MTRSSAQRQQPAVPVLTAASAPAGLHLERIATLADHTGSPEMALRFLGDYLAMLPGRPERILDSLGRADSEASMDSVLSLKAASAMAGALQAETHCHTLETLVRGGKHANAMREAQHLSAAVHRLVSGTPAILEHARRHLRPGALATRTTRAG
jgi:hypothetical protein